MLGNFFKLPPSPRSPIIFLNMNIYIWVFFFFSINFVLSVTHTHTHTPEYCERKKGYHTIKDANNGQLTMQSKVTRNNRAIIILNSFNFSNFFNRLFTCS